MARIKNIEKVIPEQVLAAAWVEPKHGVALRSMAALGGALGALTSGKCKNAALVAVPGALWIAPVKPGLVNVVAQEGGTRIPLSQLDSIAYGAGLTNLPVTVTLTSGDVFEFLVHKTRRADVDAVRAELGLA